MHETRNFLLVLLLVAAIVWAIVAFFVFDSSGAVVQRVTSLVMMVGTGSWLLYALRFEDRLPDHLAESVGVMYYEVDGLSFMPIVRVHKGRAELCVYYQNRFENPVQTIIHMRPMEDGFVIKPGMRDVHFAFKALGGDFGVIHQPIGVARRIQGDVIDIQLAAASLYPRSQGTRLRKRAGMPVGSLNVDWGGAAFKAGVHEVSGEIDLIGPATIHLSMPRNVEESLETCTWRQERLAAEEVEQLQRMHA